MFGFYAGLYPKYGDDAFGAATVSRQPPRPNKPVEAPGQLIWTRVRFPPPPFLTLCAIKNKILQADLSATFNKKGMSKKVNDKSYFLDSSIFDYFYLSIQQLLLLPDDFHECIAESVFLEPCEHAAILIHGKRTDKHFVRAV